MLLDLEYLPRIYLTSGGQIVDAQEMAQRHVMPSGYFIGTVAATNIILVGAGGGSWLRITVFRHLDLETLANIKIRRSEIV